MTDLTQRRLFITVILILLAVFSNSSNALAEDKDYQEGYITVNADIRLFYQKIGNGKEIMIIPAGFFLFEDFKHLAQNRTLIFYDMRNRGRSASVSDSSQIGIDKDVEDLEAVRKHFRVQKADLLGWSYLGLMVMLYTKSYPHHVNKIIQIGPVPLKWNEQFPDSLTHRVPVAQDTMYLTVVEKAHASGMNEKDPAMFSRIIFELMEKPRLIGNQAKISNIGCQWGDHTKYPNEQYSNLMHHMKIHFEGSIQNRTYNPEDFRKINKPVLVIHGTWDRNAVFGAGKQWAALMPRARLLRVHKAGHIPWVEEPLLVFQSIKNFLSN